MLASSIFLAVVAHWSVNIYAQYYGLRLKLHRSQTELLFSHFLKCSIAVSLHVDSDNKVFRSNLTFCTIHILHGLGLLSVYLLRSGEGLPRDHNYSKKQHYFHCWSFQCSQKLKTVTSTFGQTSETLLYHNPCFLIVKWQYISLVWFFFSAG